LKNAAGARFRSVLPQMFHSGRNDHLFPRAEHPFLSVQTPSGCAGFSAGVESLPRVHASSAYGTSISIPSVATTVSGKTARASFSRTSLALE